MWGAQEKIPNEKGVAAKKSAAALMNVTLHQLKCLYNVFTRDTLSLKHSLKKD